MKFKNTFHVFVDNFPVTYKHLLYRLVVSTITALLYAAIIYPFVRGLTGSQEFTGLIEGVKNFFIELINGRPENLGGIVEQIKNSFTALLTLISANQANIVWGVIGVMLIHCLKSFLSCLGNYTLSAIINDKMAMGAKSPYIITLVRNLKEASIYGIIYTPFSLVYDLVCYTGLFFLVFRLVPFLPLKLFLYSTCVVVAISFKMVFTADWLPALIRGKMGQIEAFLYTFDRKGKDTFNVLANIAVFVILIYAVNVCAIVSTLGTASLITIPASYMVLICFEFVNYYDRENLKYFIDKNNIIKPGKGRALTREEFFRGESD